MLLLLSTIAFAIQGQSGSWLPGAAPINMGNGRIGPDFEFAKSNIDSFSIRGIIGVQPKIALNMNFQTQEQFSYFHLGSRYLFLSRSNFRIAAFEQFQFKKDRFLSLSGLAIEIPITHIRLDASVTLLTLSNEGSNWNALLPPQSMLNTEFGFATNIAPRQELRLGDRIENGSHTPVLSYRWIGSWWFLSPSISFSNFDHLAVQLNTSLRF